MPSLRGRILNNPISRFVLAIATFVFLMHLLRSSWKGKDDTSAGLPIRSAKERKAVAHFMVRPSTIFCFGYSSYLARKHIPIHREGLADDITSRSRDGPVSQRYCPGLE
jgi:hypothetical protein